MGKVIAFKELTFYKGDYSQSSGLTESEEVPWGQGRESNWPLVGGNQRSQ